ncbi:MAG: DUF2339 domain-containing protein, partial [Pseudomonadota bacterium]
LAIAFPFVLFVMALVALLRTGTIRQEQRAFEQRMNARFASMERKLADLSSTDQATSISQAATKARKADEVSEPVDEAVEEPEVSENIETPDAETDDDTPRDAAEPPIAQDDTDAESLEKAARDNGETQQQANDNRGPWRGLKAGNTAPPPDAQRDLETLVGGRWSVLLGGLALALGMALLVRHSIEAGYLGPGMRVTLGIAFSLALLAAGEWLRRSDRDFNLPVYENADVPGIITGTGACGLFAAMFAAHGLYGFIGPATAFVALTAVGIGAMLLSSIHGPKLAAIGVLGAYGTPILVSSNTPKTLALAIHVLVVTAVVLTMAQIRNWRWLAVAGFAASTLWTCVAALGGSHYGLAGMFLVIGLSAMFATLFFLREEFGDRDRPFEVTAGIAFGALAIAAIFQIAANHQLPDTLTALAAAMIVTAISIYRTSTTPLVMAGVVIALFAVLQTDLPFWVEEGKIQTSDLVDNLVPRNKMAFIQMAIVIVLPPALLALWGSWTKLNIAPRASGWLASAVSTLAFFAVLITYLRLAPFETRPFMGMLALGIAAALALATEAFIRQETDGENRPAPAALAVGVVALAALALSIALDYGWFPMAFSLVTLGIAAIFTRRNLATLPWLAVASTLMSGLAILWNLNDGLVSVSATPVFNELVFLFGIPAAALLWAGQLLRRHTSNPASLSHGLVTASGLAVLALFVATQLTHLINAGAFSEARYSLAEASAYVLAGLGFAVGLQIIAMKSEQSLFDKASLVAGATSVLIAATSLLVEFNPFLDGRPVGTGYVFNLLLPAYLMTGLAAGVVALLSRGLRPDWYTLSYAALSGLLLFAYFTLMLRNAFQNPLLSIGRPTSDLEFLLYSPLWLVLGGIVLAVGMKFDSLAIRATSALLIGLTVFKVFLLDMAALEGLLRALSFIGLGVTLIIIGRFYQRILTRNAGTGASVE